MEFFINKNSTLPKLKMELVNDGRNDFRQFYEKVQNATIKFTMYDVETKIKKIANSTASIQLKDPNCSIGGDKPEYRTRGNRGDRGGERERGERGGRARPTTSRKGKEFSEGKQVNEVGVSDATEAPKE